MFVSKLNEGIFPSFLKVGDNLSVAWINSNPSIWQNLQPLQQKEIFSKQIILQEQKNIAKKGLMPEEKYCAKLNISLLIEDGKLPSSTFHH